MRKIEDKFYNEKQKREFIESLSKPEQGIAKSLFRYAAPLEEQNGTDVSDFTVNEVIDFYRSCDIRSIGTIRALHRLYKKYIYFVFGGDKVELGTITESVLESTLNKSAFNAKLVLPEDLDNWENILRNYTIWNPEDMFFIRAVFEGICGPSKQELEELKIDDFVCENGIYYVNIPGVYGKTIQVTKKLYNLAQESDAKHCYYVIRRPAKSAKELILSFPTSGDTIIKDVVKANNSRSNFQNRIMRRFLNIRKIIDAEHITFMDLMMSGLVYRIKCLADEKHIDIVEYVLDYSNVKEIRKVLADYNKNSMSSYQLIQTYITSFYGK